MYGTQKNIHHVQYISVVSRSDTSYYEAQARSTKSCYMLFQVSEHNPTTPK